MASPSEKSKETLELAIAKKAVAMGLVTSSDVKECLEIQQRMQRAETSKSLSDILVEQGYLTKLQWQNLAPKELSLPEDAESSVVVLDLSQEEAAIVKEKKKEVESARSSFMIIEPPHFRQDEQCPDIPGYQSVGKLGSGAMGTVYKAFQVSMERHVAIKVLDRSLSNDQMFVKRFLHEAKMVAKLNHENIVSGIDAGKTEDNIYYFIMEFVDGKPISKIIEKEKKLAVKQALEIAFQIARALEHAQKHGIVHRDIKPENIMLTTNNIAKLCDLGLVRKSGEDSSLTVSGTVLGTPQYISPEQARGEKDIDHRSDIYSLGASLYHMLTGKFPYPDVNPAVVCAMHLTQPFPDPREIEPEVPEDVSRIIKKCTEKKREDRYQTPIELIADLRKALLNLRKPGRVTKGMPAVLPQEASRPAESKPAEAKNKAADRPAGKEATRVDIALDLKPLEEEKKSAEPEVEQQEESEKPLEFLPLEEEIKAKERARQRQQKPVINQKQLAERLAKQKKKQQKMMVIGMIFLLLVVLAIVLMMVMR